MDPRLQGLAAQLALQSKLFLNCLDGVTDDAAAVRAGGTTNNMAFLAAHLVDSRHWLARVVGTIAFLVHHEAYHIGQLALLRRYTGSPAMSYR